MIKKKNACEAGVFARAGPALAIAVAWTAIWAPALAKSGDSGPDPLAAITDADPLELARAVKVIGDEGVLKRLGAEEPVEVRLAAIRAAPWMGEPEEALEALTRELGGRDSELAPAAARSAERIARGLVERPRAGRAEQRAAGLQGDTGGLGAVAERLLAAECNPALRADIRLRAGAAASMLRALRGVQPGGGGL